MNFKRISLLLAIPLFLSSQKVSTSLIRFYQTNISPCAPGCPFHPTCSEYCLQAVQRYGALQGILMGFDRLTRCNNDPWVYEHVSIDGYSKKYDPPDHPLF